MLHVSHSMSLGKHVLTIKQSTILHVAINNNSHTNSIKLDLCSAMLRFRNSAINIQIL